MSSISPTRPSLNQISQTSPQQQAPTAPETPNTSTNKSSFAKYMQGISAPAAGTRGVFGPQHHKSARLAVFQRVVEDSLRGGPFDLPQGPLRQGLVDAIAGELVNSHY